MFGCTHSPLRFQRGGGGLIPVYLNLCAVISAASCWRCLLSSLTGALPPRCLAAAIDLYAYLPTPADPPAPPIHPLSARPPPRSPLFFSGIHFHRLSVVVSLLPLCVFLSYFVSPSCRCPSSEKSKITQCRVQPLPVFFLIHILTAALGLAFLLCFCILQG